MAARESAGVASEADHQEYGMVITDPAMIRALSHPARLMIVEHLRDSDAPATATELAELVGLSPSATSYHLRAMAGHGLVEEAESRGDRRERRWRVVGGGGWQVEGGTKGDPEQRVAEEALLAVVLARADERITRWRSRIDSEPAEWSDAVAVFDTALLVTPAELAEIHAAYRELLQPYLRRNRPDPPADARVVSAHFRTVPSV
jgi:DNA-binding transcriptional ArsR family regulator